MTAGIVEEQANIMLIFTQHFHRLLRRAYPVYVKHMGEGYVEKSIPSELLSGLSQSQRYVDDRPYFAQAQQFPLGYFRYLSVECRA